MLRTLSIRDFVTVDQLELDFQTGFTALTGETGAGKSILFDALGLLLGDRAETHQIRLGAQRADLSAEFMLPAEQAQALADSLEASGFEAWRVPSPVCSFAATSKPRAVPEPGSMASLLPSRNSSSLRSNWSTSMASMHTRRSPSPSRNSPCSTSMPA